MFDFVKRKKIFKTSLETYSVKNKVRIVAIAKDEAAYLSTWIHHHLYFGFNEIEIYINNTKDNTKDLLDRISKKYPISYIVADYMFDEAECDINTLINDAYKFVLNRYFCTLLAINKQKDTSLVKKITTNINFEILKKEEQLIKSQLLDTASDKCRFEC